MQLLNAQRNAFAINHVIHATNLNCSVSVETGHVAPEVDPGTGSGTKWRQTRLISGQIAHSAREASSAVWLK
jgi:hypothetical protein